ncbi:Scramblase-domain-containing protein [Cerioporus squamosus]|nr:Scramblase-domain-containing protein [Cerioporus squamosus]
MLGLRTSPHYASLVARSTRTSRPPALGSVLTARSYAFSRFEKTRPGVGRERPRVHPLHRRDAQAESPQFKHEERPALRPPASNPEDGLRRLLMQNDNLIVTRQIEMLNIFIGLEQTNRYAITNEAGDTLGYIAEEPRGFLAAFSRQIFRTHRPFRAIVMDTEGSPILWIRRPFAFINSRMYVQRLKDFAEYTPEGEPVLDTFAEVQQRWHLWRRRYDLFLRQTSHRILSTADEPQPEPEPELFHQFARIDDGFLAWHFTLRDARGQPIANVNRAFRGFGREYRRCRCRENNHLTANAVNIDFDYFSRHSEGGGGGLFFLSTVE